MEKHLKKPEKNVVWSFGAFPPSLLLEIIISPDGTAFTVYPCTFCEKKFKSRTFLKRHRKTHPEYFAKKKHHCTDWDYATNKNTRFDHHLESHKMTTKAEKAIKFNESEEFSPAGGKGANKIFKCKFCEYQRNERWLLNTHLLAVHSKKFPHVCGECSKGFRHPSELRKHIGVLTNASIVNISLLTLQFEDTCKD